MIRMSFKEWLLREASAYPEHFLMSTLKHMEEFQFQSLPLTGFGRAPKFKVTGDILNDLNRLADFDTAYLDSIYRDMNKTNIYKGNNEVLRTLYGRFRQIKEAGESLGGARSASQIEQSLGSAEELIDNAANALDELGHHKLAEFYARAGSVAMAAKEYAIATYSREALLKGK